MGTRTSRCALTSTVAILVGLTSSFYASKARAETPAQIAERENDEGKQFMLAEKYKEASAKFRSAANWSPQPKYYLNLCKSIYQEGVFGEAIVQCQTAKKLSFDPKFQARVAETEAKIRAEAAAGHVSLEPQNDSGTGKTELSATGTAATGTATTGTDTIGATTSGADTSGGTTSGGSRSGNERSGNAGNAGTRGGNRTGNVAIQTGAEDTSGPEQSIRAPRYAVGKPKEDFASAQPQHLYAWSLGLDLFGGRGAMGRSDAYGNAVVGLRIKADHMLNPNAKFGSQIYFQASGFNSGTGTTQSGSKIDQSLQIIDFGGALFKHFCWTHLCLTPLGGVELALMNPGSKASNNSQLFNYVGFGGRLELALSYAFGGRFEHVLSAAFDFNAYTKALSEPQDGLSAQVWGLDRGGTVGSLGLGYTYRFTSARSPFLSLD